MSVLSVLFVLYVMSVLAAEIEFASSWTVTCLWYFSPEVVVKCLPNITCFKSLNDRICSLYTRKSEVVWSNKTSNFLAYECWRLSDQIGAHCQINRSKWWIMDLLLSHSLFQQFLDTWPGPIQFWKSSGIGYTDILGIFDILGKP